MKFLMKFAPLCMAAVATMASAACSSETAATGTDEDLTSLTGTARTLTFEGYVYVRPGSADSEVLSAVRKQTQSAFGALRTANIGVADRELKNVDASTFRRQELTLFDAKTGAPTGKSISRVAYRYSADAVVPNKQASQGALTLAVLTPGYGSQTKRILKECTENSSHDQEFEESIWYVFNPSLSGCKRAMAAEQQAIDAARKTSSADTSVSDLEATRLYLPLTMQFAPTGKTSNKTYPEYDRLFAGGVKKDHLVVGFVAGFAADWAAGEKVEPLDDRRWPIWLTTLDKVFQERPSFKLVRTEPEEDLTTVTTTAGEVKVPGGFRDLLDWQFGRKPSPGREVIEALAQKVVKHWLTFDAAVEVAVDGAPAKPFTIEVQTYLGAGEEGAPYKRAVKTSDVFLYAGHSYIGYGPLDPSNFREGDFPATYQMMFVNGCVSYNYYDTDYFAIKPGGSKMLDTISNGLETLQGGSGEGMGRFLSLLTSGKNASYEELLVAAQFDYEVGDWGRDGLRVVDGEQDNTFDPKKTSVTLK